MFTFGKWLAGGAFGFEAAWIMASASTNTDLLKYPFWLFLGLLVVGLLLLLPTVIRAAIKSAKDIDRWLFNRHGLAAPPAEEANEKVARTEEPDFILRSIELKKGRKLEFNVDTIVYLLIVISVIVTAFSLFYSALVH